MKFNDDYSEFAKWLKTPLSEGEIIAVKLFIAYLNIVYQNLDVEFAAERNNSPDNPQVP